MKLFISFLLIIYSFTLQAKSYYISANGNDANNGLSQSTPWKSIAKLNASFSLIVAGDSILFKCGETFYGSVIMGKSGTTPLPIVVSSYGSGSKPVITGFSTVSGWTNSGNGTWKKNVPAAAANLMVVAMDEKMQPMGRYPNAGGVNGGYLTYESINSGAPSITDNQLTAATNWTGAEIAVRKMHWIIDRCKVTAHNGSTITYTNPTGTGNVYYGKPGYGYFFQNDIRTLDQSGEWFFNTSTKDLSVYFGSSNPTGYTVKVSTIDTLFHCGGKSRSNRTNITVHNIAFEGANKAAFFAWDATNITVKNCSFNNNNDGIYMWNVSNSRTEFNTVSNCLNNGVTQRGRISSPTLLQHNTITTCGMFPGMGGSGDGHYNGVLHDGNNSTIEYNTIDSTGYNALTFDGNNVNVRYNYVSNFCMTKDDGGGIYTWSNNGNTVFNNRTVSYNTVINGISAPQGTPIFATPDVSLDAHGIYMDGGANHVNVLNNTVAGVHNGGALFLNNATDLKISGNTWYDVLIGLKLDRMPTFRLLRNISYSANISYPIRNNVFYWNGELNTPTTVTIQNDLKAIGSFDSNYHRNDVAAPFDYFYHVTANGTFVDPPAMNLASWKTFISDETHSLQTGTTENTFQYNPTDKPVTYQFTGQAKKDVFGTIYNNNITIAPFSSVLLFAYVNLPVENQLPIPSAGNDIVITLPVNSTVLAGSAIDKDGTIGSYAWTKISGPGTGMIATPGTATTALNNLVQGVYKFELNVTDNRGGAAKDTVAVTVNRAPNQLPVAYAGADQLITLPSNSVALTGTGTDAEGPVSSYIWMKIAGPSTFNISTPNAATTTVNNLAEGTYSFQLTVTDSDNAISRDTIMVTVNLAQNVLPISNAGDDQLIELPTNSSALVGKGTDIDGTIVTYAWTKISGPASGNILAPGLQNTIVNNLVEGVYQYQLMVTDNRGGMAPDTIKITVNAQVISTPLVAVAIGGSVSCTSTSTTIQVNATGGKAPFTGTGNFVANAGKGSLKISFPTIISDKATVVYTAVGAITAGKSYVLKFSTIGTTEAGMMKLVLRQNVSPYNPLAGYYTNKPFGTAKTDHQFNFTATASDANGRVDIEIAQNSGTFNIDNLAFFETTATGQLISSNLYNNGQFETSITGVNVWSSNNNQVASWDTSARINSINYYTITDVTGAKSTAAIEVLQPASMLKATVTGHNITGTATTATIVITATGGVAPYQGTGSFPKVKTGTYDYTVTDARGCSFTTTVSVVKIGGTRTANRTEDTQIEANKKLNVNCYPNPATNYFNVAINGGSNEPVNIQVQSIDGRKVYQSSGTSNKNYIVGSNFLPGVYIVKVMQGSNSEVIKIIKTK